MRRPAAVLALLAAGSLAGTALLVTSTSANADTGCVSDPRGDLSTSDGSVGSGGPRGDLLQVCADHTSARLRVVVTVAEPVDPLQDPGWTRERQPAELRVNVDVDGGGFEDNLLYRVVDGELVVEGTSTGCTGEGAFEDERYVVEVDPSCYGDPRSLGVAAYLVYPTEPESAESGLVTDFTETSEPVARRQRGASRVFGQTRIETAIAVSQRAFPEGAPVVYLAEATTFVDAITGGTLQDGPVLLVPRCGPVPEAVLEEVRRVDPAEVVAVGGPAAVCDEVLLEASAA